ncbi:MAG: PH domain-containing protein [Anaerolineae bacterium]
MARFKSLWDPVIIDDPMEAVQIRKRSSLRIRGIWWGGLALWVMVLAAGWVGQGIVAAGWAGWAQPIVGGLLMFGLIALLVWNVFRTLSGWPARYVLRGYQVQRQHRWGALLSPTAETRWVRMDGSILPAEVLETIDLANVEALRTLTPPGIWRVLETGHILLWARGRPTPLLIPYVRHPEIKAEEILRRLERLRARGLLAISEERESPQAPYSFWSGVIPQVIYSALIFVAVLFLTLVWLVLDFIQVTDLLAFTAVWVLLTLLTPLVSLPWFLISFLEWWFCIYVVTNKRIILRRGILQMVRQVLPLEDVNSVTAVRVGLGKFLNVGHVQITTAGRSSNLVMEDVSNPVGVSKRIEELQELARRQSTVMQWGEIHSRLEALLHLLPPSGPAGQL